jgi:hypothetical protein
MEVETVVAFGVHNGPHTIVLKQLIGQVSDRLYGIAV